MRSTIRKPNINKSYSSKARLTIPLVCILSFAIGLNFHYILEDAPDSTILFYEEDGIDDHDRDDGEDHIQPSQYQRRSKTILNTNYQIHKLEQQYQLANKQSYGFFDDIPSSQWKIYQQIVSQYNPHHNPNDPLEYVPGHSTRKLKYWNSPQAFYQTNYEPNFSCGLERRVGGNGNGDGPKWVCDPHRIRRIALDRQRKAAAISTTATGTQEKEKGCLVYSIGSNGDFQFEIGLQGLMGEDICEVHIFDFGDYESKMPKGRNLHYHQWGLKQQGNSKKNDKDDDDKFFSMDEIVKKLGHEKRTIDIFKIDCDKCEWRTYKDWFGSSIPMMQQILVETHNAPKDHVLPFFDTIMGQGYVMFHKEPNIQYGDGDSIEFGFLKLDDQFFSDVDSIKKT